MRRLRRLIRRWGNFWSDYAANMVPGQLRKNWQNTLNANYDFAAPGDFRCSAVRTLFLPLAAYSMITSPPNLSKTIGRTMAEHA